jgi:hypothetical protein
MGNSHHGFAAVANPRATPSAVAAIASAFGFDFWTDSVVLNPSGFFNVKWIPSLVQKSRCVEIVNVPSGFRVPLT